MADEFSLEEWLKKAKEDPRNTAGPPVVIVLALIFLSWKFFYSPQKLLLTKELKKNKGVEGQIKGLESAVANIEEIKIEVADLQKVREEGEALCYKKLEAAQFLQDLRRIGKSVGVNFKNLVPQPTVPKVFADSFHYEEYPVKITFVGDFRQLGMLLRALEKNRKLVGIDLPNLTPDASGQLKLDLLPTAILVPDEQPKPPAPPEEPQP